MTLLLAQNYRHHSYKTVVFATIVIQVLTVFTDTAVSSRRLVIQPDGEKTTMRLKETHMLKCRAIGDNPSAFSDVRWNGPNSDDNWRELEKRHKVIRSSVDGSAKLVFNSSSTNLDDSGNYTCTASYQSTDQLKSTINVEFYAPLDIQECNNRQFVILGQGDGKISCAVTSQPGPSVEITKDYKSIDTHRYGFENNDHIRINGPVQESDAGLYSIQFTLDQYGQTDERFINLEVFKPPQILAPNSSVPHFRGVEGQEATLNCQATGNPQPRILWLDAKKRNVSSVGGYHVDPETGTLKIERVSQQFDDGDFECFAENPAGKTQSLVSMSVDVRPSIQLFDNKTVEEGGQVTFECRSNGKPAPRFEIRRNGAERAYRPGDENFKEERQVTDGDIHVYQLTLKNVQKSLEGMHFCNSSNIAGWNDRVGHLRVEFKPDLDGTPRTQFFKPNKDRFVVCHVRAYPEPTIRWYFENIQLVNINASVQRSPDLKTHVISMTPPPTNPSYADYKCTASNKMGESFALIHTDLSRAPGAVSVSRHEVGATSVSLQLTVVNDGGEKIRRFIYEVIGRSSVYNNSPFNFTEHRYNGFLDAMDGRDAPYYIRNLRPKYDYSIRIKAQNDVGVGDPVEFNVMTTEPTRPSKPNINKSINGAKSSSGPSRDFIIPSQYSNGYKLLWSEPESNGDNITKYIIEYKESDLFSLSTLNTIGEVHVLEQLRDRPTYALIGPLRPGSKYKIEIKAINSIGESDPDSIIVYVEPGKPKAPEFSESSLAWLTYEQAPIAISMVVVLLVVLMIVIDLTCCYCYQIGVTYFLQSWFCPTKKNSVVSDKNYS